jgi:Big-like domain-containing protein
MKRFGTRAATLTIVLTVLMAVPAAAQNLIGNPGFELPLSGTIQTEPCGITSPPLPPSPGNWLAYAQCLGSPPARATAPEPVHSGAFSGRVLREPAGCGSGGYFYQDVPFSPVTDYEFSGWVYPVEGSQQLSILFGWDHHGTSLGFTTMNVSPGSTFFEAWGTSGTGPAISYNAWHHLALIARASSHTAEFFIDGTLVGTTAPGSAVPPLPATVLLGEGSSCNSFVGDFFYDDMFLGPAPPAQHPTTTSVKCEPQPVVAGNPTTCTATVTDTATSGATTPTGTVSFKSSGPGTFSNGAKCTLSGTGASASCSVTYTPGSTPSEPVRTDTITAEYGGDSTHEASKGTTTVAVISPTALASGSFVIGDENATIGKVVTFSDVEWWGSNWWKENTLSGGPAPSSFKGFAESSPSPPMCGEEWTSGGGNSSGPPPTVPEYMEVIAASKITQSGSTIKGNAPEVVVVKTNPGYLPNPGHHGTGKLVAIVCKT